MLAALLQTAAAVTVLHVAPLPVRHSDSAAAAIVRRLDTPWMIHPDQARRFLTLQRRSRLTESLGCMIAQSVVPPCSLQRIGPAAGIDAGRPGSLASKKLLSKSLGG